MDACKHTTDPLLTRMLTFIMGNLITPLLPLYGIEKSQVLIRSRARKTNREKRKKNINLLIP